MMSHHWLLGWCFVCLLLGLACTPADDSSDDDELVDDDASTEDDDAIDDDLFDDDLLDDDLTDDDSVDDDVADDDAVDDDATDDDTADDDAVDDDLIDDDSVDDDVTDDDTVDDDTVDDDAADDDLVDDDTADDDAIDDDTIDDDDTIAATLTEIDPATEWNWVEGQLSLAVDPADALHITFQRHQKIYYGYFEAYYDNLLYATNQSDGWSVSVIAEGWFSYYPYHTESLNRGEDSAIRADDGKVRISEYSEQVGFDQYGAYYTGSANYQERSPFYALTLLSSSCESLNFGRCTGAATGSANSLAVDGAGGAHVTYQLGDGTAFFKVIHAYYNGSDWESTLLDTCNAWSVQATAVDVDDAGHVFVAYFCDYVPYLATDQTGEWTVEALPAISVSGWMNFAALRAEGDGHLRVAYGSTNTGANLGELRYAERADSSTPWTDTALVDHVYEGLSLAVDGSGVAHLTYSDNAGVHYATNAGDVWASYLVDAVEDLPDTSVGVDSAGVVSIAYVRDDALWLAQIDGAE